MAIDVKRNDGALEVSVSGRLDSLSSTDLSEVLERELARGVESLVVDMSDTEFVSSKGLRALVAAYKKLDGKEFAIVGANDTILEVLRISGLLKIFTIR